MMKQAMVSLDLRDPVDSEGLIEALQASTAHLPKISREEALNRTGTGAQSELYYKAESCAGQLTKIGIFVDPNDDCPIDLETLRAKGIREDSASWICALWLDAFKALNKERARIAPGSLEPHLLSKMLYHARELGRLEERAWWRAGKDQSTQRTREALALSGQRQVIGGRLGNRMRSHVAFAKGCGEKAQAEANQLALEKPNLTWAAICKYIAYRYGVSPETVRKSLINPKKGR